MRGQKGFDFARCIATETFFRHQFEKDMAYDFLLNVQCTMYFTVKKILCASYFLIVFESFGKIFHKVFIITYMSFRKF